MINSQYYPAWFQTAAANAWGAQASSRLAGGKSSTEGRQESSAEAARQWLQRAGHHAFLNEVALRSLVFASPGLNRAAEQVKAVDWVASTADGSLVLVEAKSTLDSAAIGSCMDRGDKFTVTLNALKAFAALKAAQPIPRVSGLYITAKSIQISGHSLWKVPQVGGALKQGETPKLIAGIAVQVLVVPFTGV